MLAESRTITLAIFWTIGLILRPRDIQIVSITKLIIKVRLVVTEISSEILSKPLVTRVLSIASVLCTLGKKKHTKQEVDYSFLLYKETLSSIQNAESIDTST
jgi:hypothetical protein